MNTIEIFDDDSSSLKTKIIYDLIFSFLIDLLRLRVVFLTIKIIYTLIKKLKIDLYLLKKKSFNSEDREMKQFLGHIII